MNIKKMEKQYQCDTCSKNFLNVKFFLIKEGKVDMQIHQNGESLCIDLSLKDALDLAKSIKTSIKGQSKADLRTEILKIKQLNAALASTQLDAVKRLELEIERLKEIIDNEIHNRYAS